MEKRKLEDRVAEQVEKIISGSDLELVDVEFVKEREWYLRIFLDKPDKVGLEDCQMVSRALNGWLEEVDPITQPYHLEVSSPGLDRPLKKEGDLKRNLGNSVEVTFFAPWEGKKKWVGTLENFTEEALSVEIESKLMELPREKIAQIRLYLG